MIESRRRAVFGALALGGGSLRGFAHLGVLRALDVVIAPEIRSLGAVARTVARRSGAPARPARQPRTRTGEWTDRRSPGRARRR